VGARLALHLHVAKVGVDGVTDLHLGGDIRFGFRRGNEAVTNGAQLDGLAARLGDCILAGDGDAGPFPALASLNVIGAFSVNFDLAVDAHFVLEPAIDFRNDGAKRQPLAVLIFLMRLTRSAYSGALRGVLRGFGRGIHLSSSEAS
jgi:hypothetical protein